MATGNLESLYRLVEQAAPTFLEVVAEAANSARNEREFQTSITRHIQGFADSIGVSLLLREEYTLATGRADAVYNRLVIEYERPGSMRLDLGHSHTRHAVMQVKQYIAEVATREHHDRDRLLGMAWDGRVMVFARYRDGHWYEEPPLEVNRHSISRFLRSLVSLSSGRALIPKNLVEDFGAQNMYSQRITRALYNASERATDGLPAKLFLQWQRFFGQVSGYEEASLRLQNKRELRRLARGMGLQPETTDPSRLFYAIHTYFSFLLKSIARLVLERYAGGHLGTTPLTGLATLEGVALKRELVRLEDGGIFRTLGLVNLLEGDLFSWYLEAWSTEVEDALRLTLSRLAEYNPATIEEDPFAARDLLKKLYHYLLPRELRHDLGEYYTPDWLAERVLMQLNEPLLVAPRAKRPAVRLFPARRVLDPACGSGTFLILAIRSIKEHCLRQGLAEADALEYILENVVGVDLNPLAVMAARVNYLLAVADLVPYRRGPLVIPVYLADSIVTPTEGTTLFERSERRLNTVVGSLPVPQSIDTAGAISKLTDLLDECVSNLFTPQAFVARANKELSISPGGPDEATLRELYGKLLDLRAQGLDGVWARVLKNAFMPLFLGQFGYVVGNPPWVNWESLPDRYRQQIVPLWKKYGLFVHSGMDTILGKGKKDISTLMAYVAMDRYLRANGKLGFVITQTVFKTSGAAQGFRRFGLPDGTPLRVLHVDDLSDLQPFEGATNRTSVVVIQKGQANKYPVPYTRWQKTVKGKGVNYDSTLADVLAMVRRMQFQAVPIDIDDATSPWLTARRGALAVLSRVLGSSPYYAHAGVYSGGANGVYWLEVVTRRPDDLLVVRNMTEGSRKDVEETTAEIEATFVYPLLRGRDVHRWQALPSAHILMIQDPVKRQGFDEAELQASCPKTYVYLRHFETVLRKRAAFRRYFTREGSDTAPFYSMFNVGEYTFAPYAVAIRQITESMQAAVVGEVDDLVLGRKRALPTHKLLCVAVQSHEEAHYLSAVLNSTISQLFAKAVMLSTGFTAGALAKLAIPGFDPCDPVCVELSELSMRAHAAVRSGIHPLPVEEAIAEATGRLWGITESETRRIERSLSEMTEPTAGTPADEDA
ncbi:MAG: N-6 DNA methylase [bacterium]|nr:N-6 DNA methylase [bacterium]